MWKTSVAMNTAARTIIIVDVNTFINHSNLHLSPSLRLLFMASIHLPEYPLNHWHRVTAVVETDCLYTLRIVDPD